MAVFTHLPRTSRLVGATPSNFAHLRVSNPKMAMRIRIRDFTPLPFGRYARVLTALATLVMVGALVIPSSGPGGSTASAQTAPIPAVSSALSIPIPGSAPSRPYDETSYRYDPGDNGINSSETTLTPENVNPASFGRVFTVPLDGQVFAQPLVKTHVLTPVGARDLVFVCTEHDSVFAFEAGTGKLVWHSSFIDPANGITPVPAPEIENDHNIWPEMGITGTPVIDARASTLFVCADSREVRPDGIHYVQRIHALDIGTGRDRVPPVVMGDAIKDAPFETNLGPTVNGSGDGSHNGRLTFNARRENQRPALTIVKGIVYVAFASHNDIGPYHGWILGFRESDLGLVAAFNTSPNGGLNGIWMGACKIASDTDGFLYVSTGNGSFDSDLDPSGLPSRGDYGNAFLKLAPDPASTPDHPTPNGWGLKVADYFVPANWNDLNRADADVGGGGVVVLPDAAGSTEHQHLIVGGGKDKRIFLLDREHLGGFHADGDQALEQVPDQVNRIFSAPIYWNGDLFMAADGDTCKRFTLADAQLSPQPLDHSEEHFGFPGSTPVISCDRGQNPIMWLLDRGDNSLRAYGGPHFANEIYCSNDLRDRDAIGTVVRFTVPAIANGLVYAGTDDSFVAYGLLAGRKVVPLSGNQGAALGAPATPANGTAVVEGDHVLLRWTDNAGDDATYVIIRKQGTGSDYVTLAVLPAHTNRYADHFNLQPGTTYHYHILATNAAGNNDFTGTEATTP